MAFSHTEKLIGKFSETRFNPLDPELSTALHEVNLTLGSCKYYNEGQFLALRDHYCRNDGLALSVLSLNINGLPKKKDDFEIFLGNLKFDFDNIIGLTETHLNEVSCKYATLKDYKIVSNSRKGNVNWGGVAIYLRSGLTFKRRLDIDVFEEGIFESVFVEVMTNHGGYLAGVVYCPPNSDLAQFSSHLDRVLAKCKGKMCHLMGDFNLDLLNSDSHLPTRKFVNDLSSSGFHPLVSLPTRISLLEPR